MKVLIVHAHPEPRSYCTAMKSTALHVLRDQGHEVQISDLYQQNFQPVASAHDFGSRADPEYLVYALEQRQATKAGTLAADIRGELDKVLWADLLLFNFPMFWTSVPAMLKGWIDRVLVSGVCYGGKRFYDRGGLKGKRAALSFTLGGQKHMFDADGIHGPIDAYLLPLERGTLAYVGAEVLPAFAAWHVPYVSDESRQKMLVDYETWLEGLATAQPKRFPRMNDFDDLLKPRRAGMAYGT